MHTRLFRNSQSLAAKHQNNNTRTEPNKLIIVKDSNLCNSAKHKPASQYSQKFFYKKQQLQNKQQMLKMHGISAKTILFLFWVVFFCLETRLTYAEYKTEQNKKDLQIEADYMITTGQKEYCFFVDKPNAEFLVNIK